MLRAVPAGCRSGKFQKCQSFERLECAHSSTPPAASYPEGRDWDLEDGLLTRRQTRAGVDSRRSWLLFQRYSPPRRGGVDAPQGASRLPSSARRGICSLRFTLPTNSSAPKLNALYMSVCMYLLQPRAATNPAVPSESKRRPCRSSTPHRHRYTFDRPRRAPRKAECPSVEMFDRI